MEIWTLSKNRKTQEESWKKRKFINDKTGRPVNNFFDSKHPTFCHLVLQELRKVGKIRWIVFSKEEESEIFRIGRIFFNPAENTVKMIFLNCVLTPVRESNRSGFFETYIYEKIDDQGESSHLAIQIDGND